MKRLSSFLLTTLLAVTGFTAQPQDELAQQFISAPSAYSPVPIWWWSGDRVEREQIRYQLERMAEGGIHNVIILNLAPSGPLYGSAADEPLFLSDEWWELFEYALEVGEELDVKLWFYDQLGFSGSGLQARVVRDNPEFRGIELRRLARAVTGPKDVELTTPPGADVLAAFTAKMEESAPEYPLWIWDGDTLTDPTKLYFRRTFDLETVPDFAELRATCNDGFSVYVNGTYVGGDMEEVGQGGFTTAERYTVQEHLRAGKNVIAILGENVGGPGFLLFDLLFDEEAAKRGDPPDGQFPRIVSDAHFRVMREELEGWFTPEFDDSAWKSVTVLPDWMTRAWGPIAYMDLGVKPPLSDLRNVTDSIAEGRLRVKVPAGLHSVQLYYTTPGGFDYQNPDAAKALLGLVHGEMERRFEPRLGKAIAGSFQDEFPALPRFSTRFLEEFQKRYEYDLLECLPALFDNVVEPLGGTEGIPAVNVRCDAVELAAELNEEAFFLPLYRWHEKWNLLCGYDQTVRNADPVRGESYYIDYFKTMRHFSVPGNDMDGDCKPHQSIADLYSRPRVWAEVFHSSGWGQTIEEINTLLNPWLVNGATLYNPHAIYYSIHGSYWEWAPPDTGWRQPYFRHHKVFADYISRLTYALSQGKHVVRVGLLHPSSTIHGYSGFSSGTGVAHNAGGFYWAVQKALREKGVDYIILDEDSVEAGEVRGGRLVVNGIELQAVVLPGTVVLSGGTMNRLATFAEQGGTALIVGNAPNDAADRVVSQEVFQKQLAVLLDRAQQVDSSSEIVDEILKVVPREMRETLPVLHRKTGERDFYFVLSDDGTKQNGGERRKINKRNLWETAAGRGERMSLTLATDGIPERWDAVNGTIQPIHNYRRGDGYTRVDVELADSPAPLIAFRPAKTDEPQAIESDLEIMEWKHDAQRSEVIAKGRQRIAAAGNADSPHAVRMEFENAVYEGTVPAREALTIEVEGPMACRLEPTCDNTYGGFAWPPSDSVIPVEVRAAHFRAEPQGGAPAAWKSPDFDHSDWETALASFGPRAEGAGPLPKSVGGLQDISAPPRNADNPKPLVYSPRLGIPEDPVFREALGGKGRIPEEFIDFGIVKADDVYCVRTVANVESKKQVEAVLRVGGTSRRRVFLNGKEAQFEGAPEARKVRARVLLQPGPNRLEILLARDSDGPLRLFYHFLPLTGVLEDPEWIWSHKPSPDGKSVFIKTFNAAHPPKSGEMIVALGDLHRIHVNGNLVADQGNFDPYFTSRAEKYDITEHLQVGENRVEIEARDLGQTTGLLLDGLVILPDGSEIPFLSDDTFSVRPLGAAPAEAKPARILSGPSSSYMGDPALMLLRKRPHPLPEGGWLTDDPPLPAPFNSIVFSTGRDTPAAGWYRFLVPPGATTMTLQCPGQARLYVNGELVTLKSTGESHSAHLPQTNAPRRVAALRIASVAGYEEGAALLEPMQFEMGGGRIPLGSWHELGLAHYSGGLVYDTQVNIDTDARQRFVIDLGRVRGTAEVIVNGKSTGIRLWHPYRFDMTDAVKKGKNRIEIRVFNTLGPHFDVGHPSGHVFENQTLSGLFGPVMIHGLEEVEVHLKKSGS